jgi:hypothetical protein
MKGVGHGSDHVDDTAVIAHVPSMTTTATSTR